MTAVTMTGFEGVFWRPSAALRVAHKPRLDRRLAAIVLAAICAFTLLLAGAPTVSGLNLIRAGTGVAAQTNPAHALVGTRGPETPTTVGENSPYGYDSGRDLVAPSGALDDVLPYPTVTDTKLQNYVDNLYKGTTNPNRVGTGTTADAVRNELTTGLPTGGTFHSTKAQETINGLTRWLRNNPDASYSDRLVAQSLLDDLVDALGTTP